MQPVEQKSDHVLLRVRVQPKASRDAVQWDTDERIRVALTAPPVDGAANTALRRFMAKRLGLSKGSVSLVSGEKSREKTLRLEGCSADEVVRALRG